MIKGDYDKLKDIAKFNVCAEHKTPLEVAWHGEGKTWVLRCGHDHYPDVLTRQLSLTEEYKAGEEIPEPIKSNIEKRIRKKTMGQGKKSTAVTFTGVPATDLATGELLAPELVKALADYAHRYKLDPARGHVVLMHGKPYITIDGYLFYACRQGKPFTLQSRPMSAEEKEQYLTAPTDHAWLAKVILTDTGNEFTGLGIVTMEEIRAKSTRHPEQLMSPVAAAHPWQLAQKRSEWQALRRAFPISEPEEVKNETGD